MVRSSIDDFDVLSRLGAGSYGTVFKVKRKTDDVEYVIKSVRIVELSQKEQQNAINEVTILSQLESPFVVRYFDSFISGESLHLVMEYCNKGDVDGLLKKAEEKGKNSLPEDLIWDMGLQIILGLHYLHGKKVLHRDLKAANVFLMKYKDRNHPFFLVKIGDLGVAKLLETSTAFAQTIIGTPYYLSPELCADQPYREKSDCWALGILLYKCCTIQYPFDARNQCALIMKIIQAPVKPPASETISNELSRLVLWLLQKDPMLRPSTKDILNEKIIRQKLEEHGYELPIDVMHSTVTDYLSVPVLSSAGSLKSLPPLPPPPQAFEWAAEVERNRESYTTNAKESGISSGTTYKETLVGSTSSRGVVGNEVSAAQRTRERQDQVISKDGSSNSYTSDRGNVKGNRVRGSQKVQSDKARQRYQVKSPHIVAITANGKDVHAAQNLNITSSIGTSGIDHTADISNNLDKINSMTGKAEEKHEFQPVRKFSFKDDDINDYRYFNKSNGGPDSHLIINASHSSLQNPQSSTHYFNQDSVTSQLEQSGGKFNSSNISHLDNNHRNDHAADSPYEDKTDFQSNARNNGSLHNASADSSNEVKASREISQYSNDTILQISPKSEYYTSAEDESYEDDFYESDNNDSSNDSSMNRDYDKDTTLSNNCLSQNLSTESQMNRNQSSFKYLGNPNVIPDDFQVTARNEGMPIDKHGDEAKSLRRSNTLADTLALEAAMVSSKHRQINQDDRNNLNDFYQAVWKDDNANHTNGAVSSSMGRNKVDCDPNDNFDSRYKETEPGFDDWNDESYREGQVATEDVEDSYEYMESLEEFVRESRLDFVATMGKELFSDVYDLCVISMYSLTDEMVGSSIVKDEEKRYQRKLYDKMQSLKGSTIELVSSVKALVAKESTIDALKERLSLTQKHK